MFGMSGLVEVIVGAAAFFVVGAIWYGALFGKLWQKAAGLTDEEASSGNQGVIFGLCYLFELLIAAVLWHGIVRSGASDVAVMMMAVGFGACVMTPAIGIAYLFQRKPFTLFALDAAHF
ncbi:MAG: DUF1761 domain-containing protein, partial [Pseudomonadota bacterium]